MFGKASSILALLLLAVLMTSCGSSESSDVDRSGQSAATAQPAAEGYAALAAWDLDGNRKPLSEWIGKKPVVVNFWGTWCPPCRREIPDLIRLYKEYRPQGIEIVGLAVRDHPQRVRQFAVQIGMEWVMLMADDALKISFGLTGAVPTTIFLDKDGREIGRFVGRRDYEAFKEAFEAIL